MSGRMPNAAQNAFMLLFFNNTAWAGVGDGGGLQPSASPGSLYVGLNTADPGAAGNQGTNEAAYGNYARQPIARSGAGWTVSGSSPTSAQNAAACTFPMAISGTETENWFTVGVGSAGATQSSFQGPLTSPLAVSTGITPSFAIDACTCQID